MADREPPNGYARFVVGKARVVCVESVAKVLRDALTGGTLYDFAGRHPQARTLVGRGASYAIPLPENERVVVRHNRHGGLLASLTGDLFLAPTRAPLELDISEKLRSLSVPTPRVLAYVTYPATPGFERADVMTREVVNAQDLSAALMSGDSAERDRALIATASLLKELADADARHHDLNIKNVLLQPSADGGVPQAFVLDVDRVTFGLGRSATTEANLARLLRSARKWQSLHNARVTESELDSLRSVVRSALTPR